MNLAIVVAILLIPAACRSDAREARPASDTETSGVANPAPPDSLGADGAADAARAYLTALVQRDYARAASLWEEGGTAGAGDSTAFRRAHGDTTVTSFDVGAPGPMEAAAGSRYVRVPVTIAGSTPQRPPLRLHGIVTLRRSVVDGASEAQRRWRISRLEWSSNAKPAQRP